MHAFVEQSRHTEQSRELSYFSFAFICAVAARLQPVLEVFAHRAVEKIRALKDAGASTIHNHGAGVRTFQTEQYAKERRFTCAVCTEQSNNLTCADLQRIQINDGPPRVASLDSARLQNR